MPPKGSRKPKSEKRNSHERANLSRDKEKTTDQDSSEHNTSYDTEEDPDKTLTPQTVKSSLVTKKGRKVARRDYGAMDSGSQEWGDSSFSDNDESSPMTTPKQPIVIGDPGHNASITEIRRADDDSATKNDTEKEKEEEEYKENTEDDETVENMKSRINAMQSALTSARLVAQKEVSKTKGMMKELQAKKQEITSKDNVISDLNRKVTAQQQTITIISQKANEKQKKLEEKQTEVNTLSDELEEYKEKEKILREKVEKVKKENTELVKKMINYKDIDEEQEKNRQLTKENREVQAVIDNQTRRIKELEKVNLTLIKKLSSKGIIADPQPQQNTQAAIAIMDSNRKHIRKDLTDKYEWEVEDSVYTIEQLDKYLEEDVAERFEPYRIALIMMGLNDVRKNKSGYECAQKLLMLSQKITEETEGKTIPILVDIPPMIAIDNENITTERIIFNTCIQTSDTMTIETEQALVRTAEKDIIHSDRLHITTEAAKEIATEINNKINNAETPKYTPKDNIAVTELKINRNLTKFVIGKGGQQISSMEKEIGVKISTRDAGKDKKIVKITGTREKNEEAARIIQEICEKFKDEAQETKQTIPDKSKVECRYFKQGKCTHGDSCDFKHTKKRKDSRKQSQSEH